MKKRPTPYALIASTVLLFCIVGFFNYKSQASVPPDAKTPPPAPVQDPGLTAPRAAPQKNEILSKVDVGQSKGPAPTVSPSPATAPGATAGGKPMLAHPMRPGMAPNGPPAGVPSKPPKPMPNESTISGQWYSPEANHEPGKN